jgi:hypothetical protein
MSIYLERELRKTRAMLRLAYIEQRWGAVDLDFMSTDPDAKRRRELTILDLREVALLPERFYEESCQIDDNYRQTGWDRLL